MSFTICTCMAISRLFYSGHCFIIIVSSPGGVRCFSRHTLVLKKYYLTYLISISQLNRVNLQHVFQFEGKNRTVPASVTPSSIHVLQTNSRHTALEFVFS